MASAITRANPSVSTDRANQIAQRITTQVQGRDRTDQAIGACATGRTRRGGRHHHGRGDLVSAAADALGQSTSSVESALQNGQGIASLGAANGVNEDQLISALVTVLQHDNPNLTADQANQFAAELVAASGQGGNQLNVTA